MRNILVILSWTLSAVEHAEIYSKTDWTQYLKYFCGIFCKYSTSSDSPMSLYFSRMFYFQRQIFSYNTLYFSQNHCSEEKDSDNFNSLWIKLLGSVGLCKYKLRYGWRIVCLTLYSNPMMSEMNTSAEKVTIFCSNSISSQNDLAWWCIIAYPCLM